MAEANYQSKLKRAFEAQGWTVLKLSRLTLNGYPDLLLLHPLKPQVFIEVKDTGGYLSKLQEYRVKELKEKGFLVLVSEPNDYHETVSAVHTIKEFEQVLNR
jgi:hypothetical protein